MRTLSALAVITALSGAGAASAATINPWDVISHANAVVFGSGSTSADIEGQAIIGGSFSGATVDLSPSTTPYGGYPALAVYGALSGNLNVNSGGSVYVGGGDSATVNFNGGGGFVGLPASAPTTITPFQTAFDTLSTQLAGLTANSVTPTAMNQAMFNATPVGGVAVFDITAAQLSGINDFSINANGAKTIVINVAGTNINFNSNDDNFSNYTTDGKVIWNFYQATTVSLNRELGGTVLAVGAQLTNNNAIDGTLVAATWDGNGELHNHLYVGTVPEPATWAMMVLGVAGVGASLRRQRRRAAAVA